MEASLVTFISIITLFMCIGWLFAKGVQPPPAALHILSPSDPLGTTHGFISSQLGGSFILYTAECAFSDGLFAVLYPLGTALGLLTLALGIGAKLRNLKLSRPCDVFEKYYGSETLKKVASLLYIASLFGFLIVQVIAFRDFFHSIGLASELLFCAIWFAIAAYSLFFNARSAAKTDIIFGTVVICALTCALFFLTPQSVWNEVSISSSLPCLKSQLYSEMKTKISGYLLMPCLFVFIEPTVIRSCMSSKSRFSISLAAILSGVILLIFSLTPIYYGITGKALGIEGSTNSFMSVISSSRNSVFTFVAAGALFAAFAMAASYMFCSMRACILHDFLPKQKKSLPQLSTICTLALGFFALLGSYFTSDSVYVIIRSYELAVVCLLVPLMQAAFGQKRHKEDLKLAACLSMVFGAFGFFGCEWIGIKFFPELFSIFLSWLGFVLGRTYSNHKKRISMVFPKVDTMLSQSFENERMANH